jgi:CBS-domain-containing membrane protein
MVKRLQKYHLSKVSELMQRPARVFHPDTALDAAVHHVRGEGEPAIVVHPETGAFQGIVTDHSILEALEKGL